MAEANRRHFLSHSLAGLGVLMLAGCDRISQTPWIVKTLQSAEALNKRAQRLFARDQSLAREFTKADIAPEFRANGTTNPGTPEYLAHLSNDFVDWRVEIDGLVEKPLSLSLADLRKYPSRTQITRHDCVEGWSCIGEWTGAQLAPVLAEAGPLPEARYVVFHCADFMGGSYGLPQPYYESLDLLEATHPQTLLAYELNGAPLPVANGAPVRLRAERQLGYKMAKYVRRLELVQDFAHINGGRGGYWEDYGYSWWAGI